MCGVFQSRWHLFLNFYAAACCASLTALRFSNTSWACRLMTKTSKDATRYITKNKLENFARAGILLYDKEKTHTKKAFIYDK